MATRSSSSTGQSSPRRPRATTQTGGGAAKPKPAEPGNGQHGATLNLPFVTAQFQLREVHLPEVHLPEMHLPPMPDVGTWARAGFDVVRPYLPSRERAVYYAGLSVAAVFDVIDWPVAAAIAIGNALSATTTREQSAAPTKSTAK